MPRVEYVKGDTPIIYFRVKKAGALVDLTGKTLTFRFSIDGGAVIERTATAIDGPNGLAQYRFLSTDLYEAGSMTGELRVSEGSEQETTEKFERRVREPV